MPKLRNSSTDIGGFAQWLGRKCRNHNPLAELGMAGRASLSDRYKGKVSDDVYIVHAETDTPKVIYMAAGRAFVLEVRETSPAEIEGLDLVAVGY